MQFCCTSKNKSRPTCLFSTSLFPTSSGCVSISGMSAFIALTALLSTTCSRLCSSLSYWQALYFFLPFMRLLTFSFSILFLCWFESLTIYFCSEVGYIFIFMCTNFDFISKSKVNVCPPWIRQERQYAFFSLFSSTHLGFQIFFIFKRIVFFRKMLRMTCSLAAASFVLRTPVSFFFFLRYILSLLSQTRWWGVWSRV